MVKARISLCWPIRDQCWTNKFFKQLNPACVCENFPFPIEQATLMGKGLLQPKFDKVKGVLNQHLGFKNTILRGSRDTRIMVKTRMFLWWPIKDQGCTNKLFTKLNPACICEYYPSSIEQATVMEAGLGQPSFDKVKWGFHQPLDSKMLLQSSILRIYLLKLPNCNGAGKPHRRRPSTPKFWNSQRGVPATSGLKENILRGSNGRPSEWSRPEYSSYNQYRIRVVQESFLKSSILHIFVKITQLQWSRQPSQGKALYSQILMKSKGFPINLWDSKI